MRTHRRAGPGMRACRGGLLLLQVLLKVEVQVVVLHRVRRDWRSSPQPLAKRAAGERAAGRQAAQALSCDQPPPKRGKLADFLGLVLEAQARGSLTINNFVRAR